MVRALRILVGTAVAIYTLPMKVSIGDDQHYVSVTPQRGTSIQPGSPASDTNDYDYSDSAEITSLMAGRTGEITVWGLTLPSWRTASTRPGWAGTSWWSMSTRASTWPPATSASRSPVHNGFAYQQSGKPPTNTVVTVPAVTELDDLEVGLLAGEGDAGSAPPGDVPTDAQRRKTTMT